MPGSFDFRAFSVPAATDSQAGGIGLPQVSRPQRPEERATEFPSDAAGGRPETAKCGGRFGRLGRREKRTPAR